MKKTPKQELSNTVISIIRSFVGKDLCFFNIPTGTGKTFSWAYVSLTELLKTYNQVVFITLQKKLCEEFIDSLRKIIDSGTDTLTESDILYVKSNPDTLWPMYEKGELSILFAELQGLAASAKIKDKDACYDFNCKYEAFESAYKEYDKYARLKASKEYSTIWPEMKDKFDKQAWMLIQSLKDFLGKYKRYMNAENETILLLCPTLRVIFPQIDYHKKKIIIANISKAIAGIDLILDKSVSLGSYAQDCNKRRLIILDESDQCALAIRDYYISNMLNSKDYIEKNYNGILQIKSLLATLHDVTIKYNNGQLHEALHEFIHSAKSLWSKYMGQTPLYNDIFLAEDEDSEKLERRGTFLIGYSNQIRLYNDKEPNSYICYRSGDDHLTLAHANSHEELEEKYDSVVEMTLFVSICIRIQKSFFDCIGKQAALNYEVSKAAFAARISESVSNPSTERKPEEEPTQELSARSLFYRFGIQEETIKRLTKQLCDYLESTYACSRQEPEETKVREIESESDHSMYSQGLKFYYEQLNEGDNMRKVNLVYIDLSHTAEKLILSLINGLNTVVLSSATASARTVVGNFDIAYFQRVLGDRCYFIPKEMQEKLQVLLDRTYPEGHRVEAERIADASRILGHCIARPRLPAYYREMFHPDAVSQGLADWWFRLTLQKIRRTNELGGDRDKKSSDWVFPMSLLLQFAEVYHKFYHHHDIRSMIYFQNSKGDKFTQDYTILSCLIDGSFQHQKSRFIADESELPVDWTNKSINILDEWEQVRDKVIPKLEVDGTHRVMLVTAYNTIKVGCNLQYHVPQGVKVLLGDSWQSGESKILKDWDAVYLQKPTNYLNVEKDKRNSSYPLSKYNVLLSLGMLCENGYLSKFEVAKWASRAFFEPARFYFNGQTVKLDKSAWVLATLEQAIGRICRTKVKNPVTYIFYDAELENYDTDCMEEKATTIEFRALLSAINHGSADCPDKAVDVIENKRINMAVRTLNLLDKRLNVALRYNRLMLEDTIEEFEVPESVVMARKQAEYSDDVFVRYPTIPDYQVLTDKERSICFNAWADWSRDENGQCYYFVDKNWRGKSIKLVAHNHKNASQARIVSPESTRLTYFMRNTAVRQFFESHGYATGWGEGLLLHPNILVDRYTGRIGELAFIAILISLGLCSEEDIATMVHSRDWQQADVMILKDDGTFRLGFDVKNYLPGSVHEDEAGRIPAIIKQRDKERHLGSMVVTVNMMGLGERSRDGIREIYGLINEDGSLVPESVNTLKRLFELTQQ